MKEVKHYVCDICGTEYNDKKKCQECESGHVVPEKIAGCKYVAISSNRSGYPTMVHVKMSNRETITYKR